MSPVSRSSGVRVRRRHRSADYVDPWDIENEIYVKRLSVVEPNISQKACSRRTSNCYYDIAGFDEEQFQNDRLYDGGEDFWMNSSHGEFCENEFVDPYFRYKPTPCIPHYPEGHTYEECRQKQSIYYDEYYIPMSYPGNQSSNKSSQLKKVYETRTDGGFYDYGSWRWRDLPDNRLSVLSGYCSDDIQGDLTDESFAQYSELHGLPPPIPTSHFGLTKHGHLKIDYSCNWSSLDRFIGHSSNKNIEASNSLSDQIYR